MKKWRGFNHEIKMQMSFYKELLKISTDEIMKLGITDKERADEIISEYKLSHGKQFAKDLRYELKVRYYKKKKELHK